MAFLVDLHTHTREGSQCASQSVEEIISRAEQVGLDGIAITDHNHVDGAIKAQRLSRRRGIKVFVGVEVLTEEIGDVLVFGLKKNFNSVPVSLRRLAKMVEKEGGVMFAAHPFRRHTHAALWAYFDEERFDWRHQLELPDELKCLTGVETFNGGCTPEENEAAALFAARFRLRAIGGSDAHGLWRVGWCATEFEFPFSTDEDLVHALRIGRMRITRTQSEFDSERERSTHLRAMAQLKGQDLMDYVEDWMRRKRRND